jgi:putative peptidoglycan lipid II flippase
MIPGAIGLAAFQINVTVNQSFAFGENARIVSEFQYAVRLMELPQGVFGLSLATFLLPTLAALAVEKNYAQFRSTLRQGVNHIIFINLLASVLLFAMAEPIVRLLFEHGKFDPHSTDRVSFGLVCLVPGLIAFSMVNILARAFYALQDVKTFFLGRDSVLARWGSPTASVRFAIWACSCSRCGRNCGRLRWRRLSRNCRGWGWRGWRRV